MPYKDPEKRRAWNREQMRRKRQDEAYKRQEAEKKAKYFQDHKEEYAERQRKYRAAKKATKKRGGKS